jgi:hypothetical protein
LTQEETILITKVTRQKRAELKQFIDTVLEPAPAVQGVVGIGSIANGLARPDSDIDAIMFLDPLDLTIAPAEATWRPADDTFHSIFSDVAGIQVDLQRLDLAQWSDRAYAWPEGRRGEMAEGWLAFDRDDRVAELIAARTAYSDEMRLARLDEAIVWIDGHLGGDGPQRRWESLDPLVSHDRLQAAYGYLVQALFAANRRWRSWRNREMIALLALPWLPKDFCERVVDAANAPSFDHDGYMQRVQALRGLFNDLCAHLTAAGDYGDDVIGEAFVRSHDEPGRAWNMDEWNVRRDMLGANDRF